MVTSPFGALRAVAVAVVVALAAGACASGARPTVPPSGAAPSPSGTLPGPTLTSGEPAGSMGPEATQDGALSRVVDRLVTEWGAPGAMGTILRGEVGSFAASGHGDTGGAVLDGNSRFRIASITKPIVAALVLTAVDRGELTLNTVVGDVLPGYLRPTPKITVRQLLDHTSGIFDEGNEGDPVADIEKLPDPALKAEARALLAKLQAGQPIVVPARIIIGLAETHDRYFAPNQGYHYSNVNYQLAAAVLESVTKLSLADLLRERITGPMRLERTTLAPTDTRSPELRGYQKDAKGALVDLTDDLSWFGNGGNGGILSTPMELAAIFRAIASAQLFPEPLVRAMEAANRDSYGLGLGRYEQPCGTFYGHGGFVNATQSIALVSPDAATVVVLAMNLADGRDPGLARLAGEVLCPTGG